MQSGFHEFIDRFQERLNAVGEAIFETFFDLKPLELTQRSKSVQTQSQS